MSEFSAILDVLASVVNFVFNLTIDGVCGVAILASCIAVWRIPVILDQVSRISSRNSWHELACGSMVLSLLDFMLLPLSLFILLSPLRWSHIPEFFQYKNFKFREHVFSSCMGGLVDIFAYIFGLLTCMSPFGRIFTIIKSQEYYFRPGIGIDLEDLTDSTTEYSMTIIRHGCETLFDIFIIILLLPLLLLTPTVWSTTLHGIYELNKCINKPNILPNNFQYNKRQRKWYASLRTHLTNQIFHCIVDILCLPSCCLVLLSPLRRQAYWKFIQSENELIQRDNVYYSIRARSDITDIEYNYSFASRGQCLTLSLLAVADLLLLPLMLPLLLTQYRYRAMRRELWPTAEASHSLNSIPQTVQCALPSAVSDLITQDDLLSRAEAVQSADTPDEPARQHELPPGDIKSPSAPSIADVIALKGSADPARQAAAVDVDSAMIAAKLPSAPAHRREQEELSQASLEETQQKMDNVGITNKIASAPAQSTGVDVGMYDTPAVPPTEATEEKELWGIDEFALIASQAALLLTDSICLLLPLPILYVTQYRWPPVARALADDTVFLDKTSTLYGIVLGQLSLLIWDLFLTLPGVFLLLTYYRSGPMLEILSSTVRIEKEGLRLHFAVLLNCLCVLHDVLLLAPLVVLLPCFLAGYRAPIVFYTIKQYIQSQLAMMNTASHDTDTRGSYYRIEIQPPWRLRGYLWRQCLYSVLDFPFVVLSAIVVVTGWRAVELVRSVQYAFYKHTITYPSLANYSTNFRSENSLRQAVGQQFLFLLRDFAVLLPASVVSVSLYRLPQLLGLWMSALWSSGVALVSAPVYSVDNCRVDFPVRGGPLVQFTLREGAISTGNIEASAPAERVRSWDGTSSVELHVVADTLWEQAARILGQFLVSLVKGYLPLKLEDGKGINWSEFTQQCTGVGPAIMGGVNTVEDSSAVSKTLWMKLDFGTTKRTTLVKKLKLMPSTASIILQLEAYARVEKVTETAEEKLGREKRVLLRIKPTVKDLLAILERTAAMSAADSSVVPQQDDADIVSGALPSSACATSTLPPPPHHCSPAARKSNFVNSFHTSTLQVFIELCIDLAVLCMFLVTALSPLRFIRLLVAILEPESALPGRICTNTRRTVYHLDKHLLEYHKQVAAPLNQFLKEKLSDLLEDVYSDSTNNLNNNTSSTATSRRATRANRLRRHQQNILSYTFMDYLPRGGGMLTADIASVEAHHLRSYRSLCKSSVKALSLFAGCEGMEHLLTERLELHDEIMLNWYLRSAAGLQYRDLCIPTGVKSITADTTLQQSTTTVLSVTQNERDKPPAIIDRTHFDVVQLVLIEERDKLAQKLTINEQNLDAHVRELSQSSSLSRSSNDPSTSSLSMRKRLKLCVRKCGLFTRPLMDSRKLILLFCAQALSDVAFLVLFSFLLVTVVRALPLLQELYENKRWSVLQYTTRWILIKHVKQLAHDLYHLARFCLYALVLVVTVGNLPRFASHLPYHLTSYITAANCAKEHAEEVYQAIWEVLSLLVAFRTYRILLKSVLYCTIIPGACLGEAFPFPAFPAAGRFGAGLCVWVGLLVGAVFVNIRAVVDSGERVSSEYVLDTHIALLAWCAALFGVLLGCACSVGVRPAYVKPDCRAVRSARCSWDHMLAVLTGPVESIQLSAVILYFFWDFARSGQESTADSGVVSSLGADTFAAVLLVWAPSEAESDGQFQTSLSSSSDGASPRGYHTSVMVAALLVILWALLVAAPIATSTAEGDRRRAKVLSVKASPVYEFLMVVLTRLLSVWIIATLLRATSCVYDYSSSGGSEGEAVLSTVQTVSCGDGDWWASLASLSLLAYYLLTSSILHADDADLLHNTTATTQTTVKFAPLYALCMRAAQFFVCAACFTGFFGRSALSALLPILVVSIIGSVLPVIITYASPAHVGEKRYFSGQVCSVATVGVLRSAGFVSVAWTAIVCIIRAESGELGIWASETTVYVGWAVVFAIAVVVSIWEDRSIRQDWHERLTASGLGAVTDRLLQTVQSATVHESLHGNMLSAPCATSTAVVLGRPTSQHVDPVTFTATSRDNNRKGVSIAAYSSSILGVRSFPDLVFMLLQIEQNIAGERLSSEFLAQRHHWVEDLQSMLLDPLLEDTVALSSHTAVSSPLSNGTHTTNRPPRSNPLTATASAEIVATLVDMHFSVDRAEQAALETDNTSADAAVDWLLRHPQQPSSTDLESGNSVAVTPHIPPYTSTTTTSNATVPVLSPSVQRLLHSIDILQRGITTAPVSTHLSRSVFTIFLSRKLPLDICWLIFSYTLSTDQVRAVLLDRHLEAVTQPQQGYYYGTQEKPKLQSKSECKTSEFLHYASRYLRLRQNDIANTNISQ